MTSLLIKRFKPDICADSVFDIDLVSVKSDGVLGLILDIDNTLVTPKEAKPDQRVLDWLNRAQDMGFSLCILSNSSRRRCAIFSEGLGVPSISNAKKPGGRGYQKALKILNCKPREVMAIGDQLFTDVFGARRLGIRAVYTKPLTRWEVVMVMLKRVPESLLFKVFKERE